MDYNPEDVISYVPDVDDNRDLEEDEQVWVEMLPMTGEELRAYQRMMVGVKPGSRDAMSKAACMVERVMKDRVVTVHNYSDIKGKAIGNGEEMFKRGEHTVMDDVYEGLTIISKLKAGLKKK